jgi:glutathione-independent formaldehyde dehydrogenase
MPSNRGVVYLGPGRVEVQTIDYPKFSNPAGKQINHGVILKVVATNICGSDQHMESSKIRLFLKANRPLV